MNMYALPAAHPQRTRGQRNTGMPSWAPLVPRSLYRSSFFPLNPGKLQVSPLFPYWLHALLAYSQPSTFSLKADCAPPQNLGQTIALPIGPCNPPPPSCIFLITAAFLRCCALPEYGTKWASHPRSPASSRKVLLRTNVDGACSPLIAFLDDSKTA